LIPHPEQLGESSEITQSNYPKFEAQHSFEFYIQALSTELVHPNTPHNFAGRNNLKRVSMALSPLE
jgi:hypothetical protein